MSSISSSSRDGSRDRSDSRMVRHQHSFSESGRSSVPMWDSSDPDRAPPPLPLNPAAGSPLTRSNTSARIEEAAALITARARENAPSSYTSNPLPSPSTDKNIIKPHHRRMQTLQTNNIGRLSDSLERRSPEKGLRTSKLSEAEEFRSSRLDRTIARSGSETPTPGSRKPLQEENTPPSSNMLALQTLRNRQDGQPLNDISNSISPTTQPLYSFDALSSQILNITNIATNLQREMANLSKRSKDNASDLISLKDVTQSRDEDIRKTLRELIAGLDQRFAGPEHRLLTNGEATKSTPNLGRFLDDKAYNTTPNRKNIGLPRFPSPSSFSATLDRELTASPSLACVDGAASIALLEKVLREMGTKDGQDRIFQVLESVKSQVISKSSTNGFAQSAINPDIMAKLNDILSLMKEMKENSTSQALVRAFDGVSRQSHVDMYLEADAKSGQLAKAKGDDRRSSNMSSNSSDFVSEEVMKILKSVKQSLSQGGGLTNEVKVLVRELRGEVLGMGRELAKKLEEADSKARSVEPDTPGATVEEVATIVRAALKELKEHMQNVVRENRRQSAELSKPAVDAQEVMNAVRRALAEMPKPREQPLRDSAAEREEMLAAVKRAWEDCKPDIALEHFGLERDEILETLKEGLKPYKQSEPIERHHGLSYDEVIEAVRTALTDFKPPRIETEAGITREELLTTVRECLDSHDWPPTSHLSSEVSTSSLSRRDVVEAVKEGLTHQMPVAKEVEFNREDLFDAIKFCLEGEQNPLGGMGERVVEAMHEFLGSMKTEFQEYSTANGKDTEQVLDALKDGLEDLRADIESYVDRAADVTGKDEIIDTVKAGFAAMQADLEKGASSRANANTPELLDAMEKEFQHLRETISKTMARTQVSTDRDEIIEAIRDIGDDRQSVISGNNEDIIRLVKEELEHMRTALASTLIKSGSSASRDDVLDAVREGFELHRGPTRADGGESVLSNTSELLDAFQDGVEGIRADLKKLVDRPTDISSSFDILDTIKTGIDEVRSDIQRLNSRNIDGSEPANPRDRAVVVHDENMISTELEGLKVMITQLRIKVEAMDGMPPPAPSTTTEARIHKDDLDEIHTAIAGVHASVNNIKGNTTPGAGSSGNAASKDDVYAIETLLRNMKAKVDSLESGDGSSTNKTSQLDAIEDILRDIKVAVDDSASNSNDPSYKIDLELTELMLKDVQKGVEDLQAKIDDLKLGNGDFSKTEIPVIESLCMDIKSQIDGLKIPDLGTLCTKDDIANIGDNIRAFREHFEADNELTAQAFEARKIEHGGIATKIDDVKMVIGDLRDELIGKLDGSEEGIVELNKVLGMHHEHMSTYATAASVTELSSLVKDELGRQMDHLEASKNDMEVRDATLFGKHEETSSELRSVIEEKFTELMVKYDDAESSNQSKLRAMNERDSTYTETAAKTKEVVDDLKSLMDTLGSTVSETCDRMSDDAKTVFVKVDEVHSRIDELHTSNASEHGQTRDEIGRTLAVASRLEGTIATNQPMIIAAIQEVLGIVGQHYEHSRQQSESFARATEEIKVGVNAIPESIPSLLPALPASTPSTPVVREIPMTNGYDDSQVHDKLNNLISHAAVAKETFARIEAQQVHTQESLAEVQKLDEIHAKVMAAAEEISAMVATQTRLMNEHHASKAAEATEVAIALEKRAAQKERVEADIVALTEEKDLLVASMAALRKEQEELNIQTKQLTRDVARLETALEVRHGEMREMNNKAENLERRVLEGLMNHARSVKAARPRVGKKITPAERDASMSLKRVPSSASTITTKTSIKDGPTIGNAIGTALKKRNPLGSTTTSGKPNRASTVDRRILSTSHVTGNRGRETPERALVLAPAPKSGLVSLKRSQSVKTNASSYKDGRKPSWNGVVAVLADKENIEQDTCTVDDNDDASSDAGTERRSSVSGASYMYTDSLAYGTESSVSRSSGRTVSYASSIGGTINGQNDSIEEEDEEHDHKEDVEDLDQALVLHEPSTTNLEAGEDNSMALTTFEGLETPSLDVDELSDLRPPPLITGDKLKFHQESDSGLGTEPPTADYERIGEAMEYFNMTAQDINSTL